MKNLVRTSLVAASLISGGSAFAGQDELPQKISRHDMRIANRPSVDDAFEQKREAAKRTYSPKHTLGKVRGSNDIWG